jgi:hypothetical protein
MGAVSPGPGAVFAGTRLAIPPFPVSVGERTVLRGADARGIAPRRGFVYASSEPALGMVAMVARRSRRESVRPGAAGAWLDLMMARGG